MKNAFRLQSFAVLGFLSRVEGVDPVSEIGISVIPEIVHERFQESSRYHSEGSEYDTDKVYIHIFFSIISAACLSVSTSNNSPFFRYPPPIKCCKPASYNKILHGSRVNVRVRIR